MQLGSQKWEVDATDSHDPHAVKFFKQTSKILISADALWQSAFGVVFPELKELEAFN